MQNIPPVNSSAKITGSPASKDILLQKKDAGFYSAVFDFLKNGVLSFCMIFFIFSSCTPTKNSVYFKNLQKDTTLRNLAAKNYESKIQKNDVLGITVAGLSPDIAFYNAPQSTGATGGAVNGYSVDENGNIQFVKLGSLHVEGLSKKELKELIEKDLVPYLREVFVTVSFLNRHITMLGAVKPMELPMPGDNMTILDALAASGDIGETGRIDNILVIREKDDNKEFKRLNLTDNSVFYSPYFYLQPNDIVYVEPTKIKTNQTAQIFSYVTTGVTFLIFILNQLLK